MSTAPRKKRCGLPHGAPRVRAFSGLAWTVALAITGCGASQMAGAAGTAPQAAVPAIVSAFASHPVVAIAETHGLHQAGEFYEALVRDPAFQRAVDDIVIEFASRQSQPLLDRYVMAGDSLAPDTLASIWRNTTKAASWESPVYARWLAAIRDVNRKRSAGHRLRVLAGDTRIDWTALRSHSDWVALGANDESFARVILEEVLAKHRRALVVLGSNHLARGGAIRDRTPNTTTRVEKVRPGAMEIVLLYAGWPDPESTERRIAREAWPTPALVALRGSWPGELSVEAGMHPVPLETLADALLFLGPAKALDEEPPRPCSQEPSYLNELDRRSWIEWGDSTRARRFLGIGRVVEASVPSRAYGRARRVWVYTPPGYSALSTDPYDLLLTFDGREYLQDMSLSLVLDTLAAARRVPPMVAVLVDDASGAERLADLGNRRRFVTFLGDELLPWVRARWSVTRDPSHVVVAGSSAGGLAAAHAAFFRPDLFGKVLSQSGAFWRGNEGSNAAPFEWLTGRYAAEPRRDITFVLDVGSDETAGALAGTAPSILEANRRFRDVLQHKGYTLTYTEVPGGRHAVTFWQERLPGDLVRLSGARARP